MIYETLITTLCILTLYYLAVAVVKWKDILEIALKHKFLLLITIMVVSWIVVALLLWALTLLSSVL